MIKKITTFIFLAVALLVFPKAALGFGITPAEIFIEQIKPGGHFEREVYLTRPVDEADEDLRVVLETDLGEMERWFNFYPGKEFTFPNGESKTTFRVIIDVPEGVNLDTYKGEVVAKGLSDKKAKEGVTIIKGAVLGVNVVASDVDVYDLEVLSIEAPEVNSGDPVRLLLNVKNLGNTAVSPDKVTLEVMDLFEKPIESLSDTTLEKIDAFAAKEIQAEFDSNLEVGQYRIDASVVFMGEEIARKKMVLTVNARPAKAGEEYVQTQEEAPQARDNRFVIVLAALGVFTFAMLALIKLLKLDKESGSESEKRLKNLMQYKKVLIFLLAVISIVSMAVAVYYYLSLRNPLQTRQMVREQVANTEEISPNEEQEEVSPSSETEVKGVFTKSEEPVAPFVVNKLGIQGLYPIYKEPDLTSGIVYEAEDGETFDVIEQSGEWVNVVLPDGTSGWLHENSIKSSQ